MQIEALRLVERRVLEPVSKQRDEVGVRTCGFRRLLETRDDRRLGGREQVRARRPTERRVGIAKTVEVDGAERGQALQPNVQLVLD